MTVLFIEKARKFVSVKLADDYKICCSDCVLNAASDKSKFNDGCTYYFLCAHELFFKEAGPTAIKKYLKAAADAYMPDLSSALEEAFKQKVKMSERASVN